MDNNMNASAVRTKAASDIYAGWKDSDSPITITQNVINSITLNRANGDMYVWLQPTYDIYFNFTDDDEYDGVALIDDGFESGVTGLNSLTATTITQSSTYYRSGTKSARLASGSGTVYDSITTVVGAKYEARVWIYKPVGGNDITATIRKADNPTLVITNVVIGDVITGSASISGWVESVVKFTATATTTYIGVFLSSGNTAYWYIDDITCKPLSNVLASRDMWLPGGSGPVAIRIPWGLAGREDQTLKLNLLNKIATASTTVKFRVA